jgi:hypothetical protein
MKILFFKPSAIKVWIGEVEDGRKTAVFTVNLAPSII